MVSLFHRSKGPKGTPSREDTPGTESEGGSESTGSVSIGMLSEAGVIVFISEPSRSDHMDIPVLIKEFGLTPAEARLANSLVAGHSLAEIAESKEISIETARSLLKRAMAKTDTRSQAHLIGKLYRSLAWLHRE